MTVPKTRLKARCRTCGALIRTEFLDDRGLCGCCLRTDPLFEVTEAGLTYHDAHGGDQ